MPANADHPTSGGQPSSPDEIRKVVLSSFLGNTIEFYDFILFASAAALIFDRLFFSNLDHSVAIIVSFAVLATGYVARPLGGVVLGYLGDRLGRKSVLLTTMIMMGAASGLIGLLPTYEQIGVAAPLLLVLLRLVQGFAVGGEWGGAALLAAEHAPPERRGWITALGQAGLPAGGLLSTIAMALVALLPSRHLFSWGWRIPFLISFALLGLGLYVRMRVAESPLFEQLVAEQRSRLRPFRDIARRPLTLLRGVVAGIPPIMVSSLFGSFAVSYAVGIGYSRSTVLWALGVGWAGAIIMTPVYGRLSDRVGRRPVYLGGAVGFAVLAFPLFWMINSGSTALLFLALVVVFTLISVAMSSALAALLSEMFRTESRYTGVSVSYQASGVAAGFVPLIAGGLLAAAGGGRNIELVAGFVIVVALSAAVIVGSGRESRGTDLRTLTVSSPEPAPKVTKSPADV
ncbi:MHS family MFS transporter [Actinomadura madurae]|uniref:MFS transporter n=1 Tax=Actinomadura madurae TaxID=1993 RepID=UPI002025ECE8|nr:MFS transporter [Actinomadura madurae]URN04561.1 MHS family MFS transporter [Actinomadura madurae]